MLETKAIELKRGYTDDIKYAIVAFANTDGGKIYIGLNDDGSVCGVEDVDTVLLRIANMVRDVVRPDVTMFMDCEVRSMDGKNVIAVIIQRGAARPYYLAGKGVRPEGVYVRQGAFSVPASAAVILDMIKETSGDCYEEARSLNQQLTFEKAGAYFQKKKIEFGEAQKRTLNIIGQDGTYSNLALLLSDQCMHTIKMAVFDGSQKSVFRDRKELTGSLLGQMEEAYSYMNQFNRTRAEFLELERIDQRDYPPEALREALLNAIVHRDYAISGATLISIFDDRMEFVTIGGLVKGISYDDIMLGVSVLRNQHLANVFYRLHLIEAYGTGILKINECYADCKVKSKIEVTDHAFKITLPNRNYLKEHPAPSAVHEAKQGYSVTKDARKEIILGLFAQQESISRKDVEEALQVSQATAVLMIRDLLKKGVLVKENGGKYSRYRLGY